MTKRLLLLTFCGLFLASCGAVTAPMPTSMWTPPSPTPVPLPTFTSPTLLAEQDLDTHAM